MAKNFNFKEQDLTLFDGGSIYNNDNSGSINQFPYNEEHNILLVPLANEVFFPYMQIGSIIDHPDSIANIVKAYKDHEPVFFFLASDTMPEETSLTEPQDVIHSRGVVGYIKEIKRNNDNDAIFYTAMLGPRAIALSLNRRLPYMRGDIIYADAERVSPTPKEIDITRQINEVYSSVTEHLSDDDRKHLFELLEKLPKDSVRRFYFMVQNSPLDADARFELLQLSTLSEQRKRFLDLLESQIGELNMRENDG